MWLNWIAHDFGELVKRRRKGMELEMAKYTFVTKDRIGEMKLSCDVRQLFSSQKELPTPRVRPPQCERFIANLLFLPFNFIIYCTQIMFHRSDANVDRMWRFFFSEESRLCNRLKSNELRFAMKFSLFDETVFFFFFLSQSPTLWLIITIFIAGMFFDLNSFQANSITVISSSCPGVGYETRYVGRNPAIKSQS